MLYLLVFILMFLILSVSVAGFAKLLMVAIAPGEIFSAWQKVLSRLEKKSRTKEPRFFYEFWYKSLGGCDTCTRQRIAELTYICLALLIYGTSGQWVTTPVFEWIDSLSTALAWVVIIPMNALIYGLFCGLVIFFGKLLEYQKKQTQAAEEIIEQTPNRKQ